MLNWRPSKYLMKLILFSLSICTLPVIVFGGISFMDASGRIEDKVIQEKMQVLHQTQMRLEQDLKALDSSMTQFSMSTQVYNALQQDLTPNNYKQADLLLEGMQGLQSFELPVVNVYLLSMEHRWLLHNKGVTPLDDSNHTHELLDFIGNPKSSFWSVGKRSGPNDSPTPNGLIQSLNMVKKLPVYSLHPKGLIVAQLSPSAIQVVLSQNELSETIVLDEAGIILAHPEESMLGQSMSPMQNVEPLLQTNASSGHFSMKLDGQSSEILYRKSSYNGWTYLTIVPFEVISKESWDMGKILILYGLLILALMFVIVFQGSRGIYNPIRKLYTITVGERKPGKEQSAGDELGLIEERILSFQRMQLQMAEQLQSNQGQLKDLFAMKLLQGTLSSEEIEEKCRSLDLSANWKWMSILSLQIDKLEGSDEREQNQDWAVLSMNRYLTEMIPDHLRLNPVLINHMPTVLLGSHQASVDEFKVFLHRTADLIQKEMKRHLATDLSIGISRPYQHLQHTGTAYEESCEALKYRLRLGPGAVLFIEDVEPGRRQHPLVSKQMEDELVEAVQIGDTQRAETLFSRFIEEICSQEMTHREYQTILLHLLTEVLRVVQNAGESVESVYPDEESLFDRIFELKTAQEMELWFSRSVIKPAAQLMERHQAAMYKSISEKVIELIREEYDQDLSLELCASRINYHSSYVKQVFRKEIGMNFSDYLMSYRMNMAKKWLLETDMKISDIAEKLRYTNSQNFIRSFRKTEGVTPGQYRQTGQSG